MHKRCESTALTIAVSAAVVAASIFAGAPASATPVATVSPSIEQPAVFDFGNDIIEVPGGAEPSRAAHTASSAVAAAPVVHYVWASVVKVTATAGDDDVANLDEANVAAMIKRLNTYWLAESAGTISIALAGYEMRSLSQSTCSLSPVFDTVIELAFNKKFEKQAWRGTNDHLMMLTAEGAACGLGGLGYLGGNGLISSFGTSAGLGTPAMAHEFGHNFGFDHAGATICRSTTNFDAAIANFGTEIDNPAFTCPTEDYGDFFDVMGYALNGSMPHISSPQRIAKGYLSDYTTVTPSSAGTFTVAALGNTATAGATRALKVKDPMTGEFYYLEYRTSAGIDATAAEFSWGPREVMSVDGYILAMANGNISTGEVRVLRSRASSGPGFLGTSVLATGVVAGAPKTRKTRLDAGKSFTNDKGIFTATVNSMTPAGGAKITIDYNLPTTTSLALDRSATQYYNSGPTITATAKVAPVAGVIPQGTLTIRVDGTSVASGTTGPTGTFSASLPASMAPGSRAVVASFAPTSTSYVASVSPTVAATAIMPIGSSTVTAKAVPATQVYGAAKIGVEAQAGTVSGVYPAGAFALVIDSKPSAPVAADATGRAVLRVPATLTVGTHKVAVQFIPNNVEIQPSASAASLITVSKAKAKATLTLASSKIKKKKTSTATVTIAVAGVPAPTGTITLYSKGKKISAYTLSSSKKGKIAITVPKFAKKGTVTLTVKYAGTTNILATTSAAVKLKVK